MIFCGNLPTRRPSAARLSGREEVVRHLNWFLGTVENFRFFDIRVYAFVDPEAAVAEFKAEGLIKPTGRVHRQDYVVFLRSIGRKDCITTRIF
jgi:ketosteroid isomerase-like protein